MASYMPTYGANALQTGGASAGAGIVPGTDTFKLALYTGTVPSANRDAATQYYAGATLITEASGTGYTATGSAVAISAAQPAVYTTGSVHYSTVGSSVTNIQWTTATLTSVTFAALYDNTSSTKWAVAVYDFGGAQSVTANTFQVNFTSSFPTNTLWYLVCN